MAKDIEFEMRVCTSGTNGVAFYVPSEIVKVAKLRKEVNRKAIRKF